MQLCLSGLSDRSRLQANAALLGASLLMEDVLNSGGDAAPVRLHGNNEPFLPEGAPNEVKGRFVVALLSVSLRPVNSVLPLPQSDKLCLEAEAEKSRASDSSAPPRDPIRVQSVLKGFLLLLKQLQVFQESWAQRRLGVEMFGMSQQTVVKLYRYSGTHSDMLLSFC